MAINIFYTYPIPNCLIISEFQDRVRFPARAGVVFNNTRVNSIKLIAI